jgi:carbon storage regulator CsrA
MFSRQKGESVVLTTPAGERIVVWVDGVDRGKVKLGFDAPRSVIVDRAEIDAKKEKRCACARQHGDDGLLCGYCEAARMTEERQRSKGGI